MKRTAAALIAVGFLGWPRTPRRRAWSCSAICRWAWRRRSRRRRSRNARAKASTRRRPLSIGRGRCSSCCATSRPRQADRRDVATQGLYGADVSNVTLEFQKRTAEDPTLTPQRDVSDILALGGGVPIVIGNEVIGGVGSSGSSQTMDDACAKAGVAKVADQFK